VISERLAQLWATRPHWQRWLLLAALVAFFFALPLLKVPILDTPDSDFNTVLFAPVGIYVLMAIGLNIVVGQAGLLDLGYVAFYAIGGYTMALLGIDLHWNFWAILPVAVLVSMAAGVILGTPTLRLRGDYLAIVTLGFGEIVRITANQSNWLGGPRGKFGIPHPPGIHFPRHLHGFWHHFDWLWTHLLPRFVHLRGKAIDFKLLDPKPYYWLLLIFIILVIFLARRLEHSRVGRAWTAIREDEDAAELMGVPTFRFKLWAFAMGAGFGGLGGVLYASKAISIVPDNYQLILSILFLSAVVLGGSGNLVGVIVGAIVVAYLPERFRGFDQYRVMVFGAALVIMMIFRPQGLLPSRRRAQEMKSTEGEGALGRLGAEVVPESVEAVDLP
jgi:branched-chain amino acid transport system permease protein